MTIAVLALLGLCFGSFTNALVWRLHEQAGLKKPTKRQKSELSISTGRSMCTHCRHVLGVHDLIPVLSWLSLKGRCRYCKKPISVQYPAVELLMALLFIGSFVFWPQPLRGGQWILFGLWLPIVVSLVALSIYDIRWYLLPNRLVAIVTLLAGTQAIVRIVLSDSVWHSLINLVIDVLIGGGIFLVLHLVSDGRWIGGGDVKLGAALGILLGSPAQAFLFLFGASVLGTLYSLPLLLSGRLKKDSHIPFGPFLILSVVLVYLFGASFLHWYEHLLLLPTI